jgi:hypothetical protein
MKRLCAILGLMLFVLGVLLAPTIHKTHLARANRHDASHGPDTCAVCCVSAAAMIAACAAIVVISFRPRFHTANIPDILVMTIFVPGHHTARAPPSART